MTMPKTKSLSLIGADAAVDIERLAAAFAQFRRTHAAGTRIPPALRDRVGRALGQGVSGTRIQKICRLSWIQVKKMRFPGLVRHAVPAPAHVLSVVDDEVRGPALAE